VSAAVGFALASLLFAGVNDVVFKYYSRASRSRGMYILGMGLVWTVLQLAIVLFGGLAVSMDLRTVGFGLAAGLLVGLSNMMLVESLTGIDVGIASTVYRLNTIAVVVLAVLLLGEPLTGLKAGGILLGIAAVFLLLERVAHGEARRTFALYFALVVVAALLRAGFGILSKVAAQQGVDLQLMLLVNAPVWVVVGAAYAISREGGIRVTAATVRFSLLSGALICAIANFLMLAIARGEASVVVPIANMSFVVAMLLSAALGMERLSGRKVAAVSLAGVAIAMLAQA
jgi:drug/metabolite transporter (DMT)-like permease